jgi:hypothetical protein
MVSVSAELEVYPVYCAVHLLRLKVSTDFLSPQENPEEPRTFSPAKKEEAGLAIARLHVHAFLVLSL